MSDAQYNQIDDEVRTLVRLCGYSPERARTELDALSYREKVGLIPAAQALQILVQTASASDQCEVLASNQQRWREILRDSENWLGSLAA
jgi:GTP-dependent phosphoenolpyruvate carboxykinase